MQTLPGSIIQGKFLDLLTPRLWPRAVNLGCTPGRLAGVAQNDGTAILLHVPIHEDMIPMVLGVARRGQRGTRHSLAGFYIRLGPGVAVTDGGGGGCRAIMKQAKYSVCGKMD